jgi:cytochrome c
LGKKGHSIEERRAAAMLLTAVLIAILLSPAAASGQALRKDSNTKSAVAASEARQTVPGKELFRQHCASCHFTETTAQKIGPGLKGLYPRLTFSDGKKVTDASLTKWIEAGGKNMPGFKETIKPEQIRELISYIKTL